MGQGWIQEQNHDWGQYPSKFQDQDHAYWRLKLPSFWVACGSRVELIDQQRQPHIELRSNQQEVADLRRRHLPSVWGLPRDRFVFRFLKQGDRVLQIIYSIKNFQDEKEIRRGLLAWLPQTEVLHFPGRNWNWTQEFDACSCLWTFTDFAVSSFWRCAHEAR